MGKQNPCGNKIRVETKIRGETKIRVETNSTTYFNPKQKIRTLAKKNKTTNK